MNSNFVYPIFERQLDIIRSAGELRADHVRNLYIHFSTIAFYSLELVKHKAAGLNIVTKISSKSGRYIYKVTEIGSEYICNLKPAYCPCTDFMKQVVFEEESIMCAHIMAVYLSDALNLLEFDILEDIPFAEEYYFSTEHK